mgnify:CR=1 FL=1
MQRKNPHIQRIRDIGPDFKDVPGGVETNVLRGFLSAEDERNLNVVDKDLNSRAKRFKQNLNRDEKQILEDVKSGFKVCISSDTYDALETSLMSISWGGIRLETSIIRDDEFIIDAWSELSEQGDKYDISDLIDELNYDDDHQFTLEGWVRFKKEYPEEYLTYKGYKTEPAMRFTEYLIQKHDLEPENPDIWKTDYDDIP